jgi:hypothetical protein
MRDAARMEALMADIMTPSGLVAMPFGCVAARKVPDVPSDDFGALFRRSSADQFGSPGWIK